VSKTVLITGTSSGIGRETALYFASKGWNVVATMRNPESRQTDLRGRDHIDCVHLDVLDIESVRKAVRFAKDKYSSIDVIVNNAGFATLGPMIRDRTISSVMSGERETTARFCKGVRFSV
jgi:NAD(P)-dependent dehydrogenase (short-subunit alcohol dehydrogenase family)